MSNLIVRCPHCGEAHEDVFDVLGEGTHEFLCSHCRRVFHVWLGECPRCVADILVIGECPVGSPAVCSTCGASLRDASGEDAD